jgi:hypothetical protein
MRRAREHPRKNRMHLNWLAQSRRQKRISQTLQKQKAVAPASSHGTSGIQLFDFRIPGLQIRDYILRRHIRKSAFLDLSTGTSLCSI